MDYLPIFLKVQDRPCLVVGGGKVAARKVSLLQRAGARVTVVAPEFRDDLRRLAEQGEVDRFCEELSQIVKRYLGDVTGWS